MEPTTTERGSAMDLDGMVLEDYPVLEEYAESHPGIYTYYPNGEPGRKSRSWLHTAAFLASISAEVRRTRVREEGLPDVDGIVMLRTVVGGDSGPRLGPRLAQYLQYLPLGTVVHSRDTVKDLRIESNGILTPTEETPSAPADVVALECLVALHIRHVTACPHCLLKKPCRIEQRLQEVLT